MLIVEDNPTLADNIRRALRRADIAADSVHTGEDALAACAHTAYDVVVLDRRLPGISGDDVCRQLAGGTLTPRVLMLTSLGAVHDELDGLQLGADDYVSKPFEMQLLVARVRALARRPSRTVASVLRVGDIEMNPATRKVTRNDRPIILTRNEFAVLEELLAADGAVLSAEELLERVWDANADPFTNAVRITIMTLRRKLGAPDPVVTARGVGYRLEPT